MRRLLAQLSTILVLGIMLAGCPSREGAVPVDDPEPYFPERLSLGVPVFSDIVIPLYGRTNSDVEAASDDEDIVSLLSYDADAAIAENSNPRVVNQSKSINSSSISVALNTIDDNLGRSEMSVMVSDDNVFKIDHLSGEIRLLAHFVNRVCEVIPVDVVQTDTTSVGQNVSHTVLNGDWVYIMTAENNDCFDQNNAKRFYHLPLTYQFDSDDLDDSTTKELLIVPESLARAQLVFGWVDDEVTLTPGDQRLDYGYLGYGLAEQELRFFNSAREQQWSQAREIETFPVVDLGQQTAYSPEYIASLTPLGQYQYMLQLGLDIFVFDSSTELFARNFDESDDALNDRVFKMEAVSTDNGSEILKAVEMRYDDDEVIIVDNAKIYRYNYASQVVEPVTSRDFTVKQQPLLDVDVDHKSAPFFSQFDLGSCLESNDVAACNAAHNLDPILNDNWQFIVDCTAAVNCSLEPEVVDYCATLSEVIADPDAGTLCTASNYRHLSELNDVTNDAEFRGFMQYHASYIRNLDLNLNQDSLYITARMLEKDILIRYFYNVELTEPKPSRESVLLGERIKHFGIDAYISQNNLFVTTLLPDQVRSNECYKNYQRVICDLGNTVSGNLDSCTGQDLNDGLCADKFIEYESLALFCSEGDIDTGLCTDAELAPVNSLSVEEAGQDAKWIALRDFATSTPESPDMYLLLADESDAQDEGVLLEAELVPVSEGSGNVISGATLGNVEQVESVVGGWLADATLGRLDVIENEVVQKGLGITSSTTSVANVYFLRNPKSGSGTATNIIDSIFLRPLTQ